MTGTLDPSTSWATRYAAGTEASGPTHARTAAVCAVFMPMLPGYEGIRAAVADAVKSAGAQIWRLEALQPDHDWQLWVSEAVDAASLVLADVTDNNPYVMYELGVAHGHRRQTLLFVNERNPCVPATVKGAFFLPYGDSDLHTFAQRLAREIRRRLRPTQPARAAAPADDLHARARELLIQLAGHEAHGLDLVAADAFSTFLDVARRRGEFPPAEAGLRDAAHVLLARLLRDSDRCEVMRRLERWVDRDGAAT